MLFINGFKFPAEKCFTENNIQYKSNQFPDDSPEPGEIKNAKECIEHCKTTHGEKAQFFSYNKWNANVGGKFKRLCRCKIDQEGRRKVNGVISGNLWCGEDESNGL